MVTPGMLVLFTTPVVMSYGAQLRGTPESSAPGHEIRFVLQLHANDAVSAFTRCAGWGSGRARGKQKGEVD
jgi:hypothetical protein